MSDERIEIEGVSPTDPEGYDAWFRREVEHGIREANDSNTVFSTLEEVEERMRIRRAQRPEGRDEPTTYDEWLKRELAVGIAELTIPILSHTVSRKWKSLWSNKRLHTCVNRSRRQVEGSIHFPKRVLICTGIENTLPVSA